MSRLLEFVLRAEQYDFDERSPEQVARWFQDGIEIHVEAQDDLPPLVVSVDVDTVGERPSAEMLAGHVIAQITHEVEGTGTITIPEGTTFADLHDQCDANMFLIYAAEDLGWTADAGSEADAAALNLAMDRVNAWLALPLRHLRGGGREE